MSTTTTAKLESRKRRIRKRLASRHASSRATPVFSASNIHYGVADRTRAISAGGIGAIHLLSRQVGLVDASHCDAKAAAELMSGYGRPDPRWLFQWGRTETNT